jgi:hypothetical protein
MKFRDFAGSRVLDHAQVLVAFPGGEGAGLHEQLEGEIARGPGAATRVLQGQLHVDAATRADAGDLKKEKA